MTRQIRITTDAIMAIFLFSSMAYALTGNFIHECIGTFAVILFVFHVVLNRRWVSMIPSGRYNRQRVLMLVLNTLLVISVFFVFVSGLMLSRDIFSFFPSGKGLLAHEIHTTSATWCFILTATHAGLHSRALLSFVRRSRKCDKKNAPRHCIQGKWIIHCLALVCLIFGALAFFRRGIGGKLTMHTTFDAFALDDSLLQFSFDYFSVAALFFLIAHYTQTRLLSKTR